MCIDSYNHANCLVPLDSSLNEFELPVIILVNGCNDDLLGNTLVKMIIRNLKQVKDEKVKVKLLVLIDREEYYPTLKNSYTDIQDFNFEYSGFDCANFNDINQVYENLMKYLMLKSINTHGIIKDTNNVLKPLIFFITRNTNQDHQIGFYKLKTRVYFNAATKVAIVTDESINDFLLDFCEDNENIFLSSDLYEEDLKRVIHKAINTSICSYVF